MRKRTAAAALSAGATTACVPRSAGRKGGHVKVYAAALVLVSALAVAATAGAAKPPATTFVAVLTPEAEVPRCTTATNAAGGLAIFHVIDEATGTVEYKIITHNLPGTTTAAHIHGVGAAGVAAPVLQPTPITPGADNGVIGEGTFSNPGLLAAIRTNPQNYYENVHTSGPAGCPPGAARGQLDEHGPSNK